MDPTERQRLMQAIPAFFHDRTVAWQSRAVAVAGVSDEDICAGLMQQPNAVRLDAIERYVDGKAES